MCARACGIVGIEISDCGLGNEIYTHVSFVGFAIELINPGNRYLYIC